MKGPHLGTIELVNEGTIKTIGSITGIMGCHIMKGLPFVYFKEKKKNNNLGHLRNEAILLLLKRECRSSFGMD